MALWRRLLAELLGSGFLAAVVVGSGIAAQRLSPAQTGLELLENAAATPPASHIVGGCSGGYRVFFRPRWGGRGGGPPPRGGGGGGGAGGGGFRAGGWGEGPSPAHFLSEIVATLGLILVIFALARSGRSRAAPAAVGAYIGAAYFFTSSTSFANPAITIGRMFSDTFAGIAPPSVPGFIAAQIIGPGWPL